MRTKIQGECCGWDQLMVGECDVLGWWRLDVVCVPWAGCVDHKWPPVSPRHNTPTLLFHSCGGVWCSRCLHLVHLLLKQCYFVLQKLISLLQLGVDCLRFISTVNNTVHLFLHIYLYPIVSVNRFCRCSSRD